MKDQLTLASINLNAVLRNLEDLCKLDEEMKKLITDKNMRIQFQIRSGPNALLSFSGGACSFKKGNGKCDIKLYFKSPEHFNKMIDGKANPIPLKGITKINFLKNEFIKLTDRLSFYLKPTEELLKDNKYFQINTILTSYTAFFALGEIGNNDKIGKLNSKRIPNGTILISVANGPSISINASNGHLDMSKEATKNPRASMSFTNLETANQLLNGKIDSYTCIATGQLQIKGFIPMIDNMNKILSQVPAYLS